MKVTVGNLPMYCFATAEVTVPDDTPKDELDSAIADAVEKGDYTVLDSDPPDDVDFRSACDSGWEYLVEDDRDGK